MANPRQRKKLRSGSHKPVRHSRRAKTLLKKQPPIRGPQVLQEAWDKHKTVRQNYEALGLVATLTPTQSGGMEHPLAPPNAPQPTASTSSSAAAASETAQGTNSVPKGYGRIIRDQDGNVIDVEMPDEEPEVAPVEEAMAEPDPSKDEALAPWVGHGAQKRLGENCAPERNVVQALEDLSRARGRRPARFASAGELATLRRLVEKYGEDVEGMARDRRLNRDQRTAGELSRTIKKVGGFAVLG